MEPSSFTRRKFLRAASAVAAFGAGDLVAQSSAPPGLEKMPLTPPTAVQLVDVHAHLFSGENYNLQNALQAALQYKNRLGIRKTLLLPPPFRFGSPAMHDYDDLVPFVASHAERFGFIGGGGILNPIIHDHAREAAISASVRKKFEAAAERIPAAGAAGFGEIAAHHVSYFPQHPYESVPADHPLLRLLADIAARSGLPLDLHLDPVPRDMAPPASLSSRSNNNPSTLRENISGLERLLEHNRGAKIVWAHAGRDNLGTWSFELSRGLLSRHPNLHMSLSIHPPGLVNYENSLLDAARQPNPKWIAFLAEFPDRFVVGTDFFYYGSDRRDTRFLPPPTGAIRRFINALPQELASKVAHENATRIYRLGAA